jgi:flagellar protein FliS
MELHAASPERLVVFTFEQLVVNLERGRIAMERNDLELRVTALRRARGLVGEWLATLDFDKELVFDAAVSFGRKVTS